MLTRLLEFSVRQRVFVLLATVVLIGIGIYSALRLPIDAVPDITNVQVQVNTAVPALAPEEIEKLVTFPIENEMAGIPGLTELRSLSKFGLSQVTLVFEDGTDIYWARSRVLEYLSKVTSSLPPGVKTEIGPDATGVGWIFQYALVDESGKHSLADIRSFQDWNLRFALQSVPGVAEVASVGGFQNQYQVTVDRTRLASYNIPIMMVAEAVRNSNVEVGGKLIEFAGREFMVRGRGYVKKVEDLEQVVLKTDERGTPVLVRDVARVERGPELRRGIADLDGRGDVVGGIVATLAHVFVQPDSTIPVVGASGAVAAVMGAYLVWFPNVRVHTLFFFFLIMFRDISAKWLLLIWFGTQFLDFFNPNSGVAWMAHVGGFVFGMAIGGIVRASGGARRLAWQHDYDRY